MKIDRIQYQKVFPIGSYATERIGLEASLEDGDTPEFELANLKKMVDDLHSATIATLEETRGTTTKTIEEQTQDNKTPLQMMEDAINQCSTVPVLESFKLIVKNNPDLQPTYDNKLKSLTDGL